MQSSKHNYEANTVICHRSIGEDTDTERLVPRDRVSQWQGCDKAWGPVFLTSRKTRKKGRNQGGNATERKLPGFQSFVKSPVAEHWRRKKKRRRGGCLKTSLASLNRRQKHIGDTCCCAGTEYLLNVGCFHILTSPS